MGHQTTIESPIILQLGEFNLHGLLAIPHEPQGVVLFAHGSGSSHKSPRNQFIAKFLQEGNFATLLFDLLTLEEEQQDMMTRELRFNISFLSTRLHAATHWVSQQEKIGQLPIGYFGASTGAAAAVVTASELGDKIKAVVSRGASRFSRAISGSVKITHLIGCGWS